MASLWSLVQDNKSGCVLDAAEELREVCFRIIPQLRGFPKQNIPPAFPLFLVNITDFAAQYDLAITERTLLECNIEALDMTPCHRYLWFEFMVEKPAPPHRQAVLICRRSIPQELNTRNCPWSQTEIPPTAKHYLEMLFWGEHNGKAVLAAWLQLFIDALGCPISLSPYCGSAHIEGGIYAQMRMLSEILTIMNTQGTRIDPPPDQPHPGKTKPTRRPSSVWHTIHLPYFAEPPLKPAEIVKQIVEKREHWVRAHRADYRRGNGLFGRVKAIIWVPEHKRGNPELGSVKQSFTVHPSPPKL